jgi:hypothetical protein
MKYAYAQTTSTSIGQQGWSRVRKAARANVQESILERASKMFGKPFDPSKYLISHATIVASVDTYAPPNAPTGKILFEGQQINRRFADFRVKPDCSDLINNNNDAWDRGVLLLSYPTFIGGQNYVEHVQQLDLSKGRILDAVARDVGRSIYTDILIATDLRHTALIQDIRKQRMNTLSMGCMVEGTICTQCGNWSEDDSKACTHIKFMKGTTFLDENGRPQKVAELCGHQSIGPTGGVTFKEASWVADPAFKGAVLRNILSTDDLGDTVTQQLDTPPAQWGSRLERRAGRRIYAFDWEADADAPSEAAPEAAPPAEPKKSPLADAEDDLVRHLQERAVRKVKKNLEKEDQEDALDKDPVSENDNLVKEGSFRASIREAVRFSSNEEDLICRVASVDAQAGLALAPSIYKTAALLGPLSNYRSERHYKSSCTHLLGYTPSDERMSWLIRLGKILSLRDRDRSAGKTQPGRHRRPQ